MIDDFPILFQRGTKRDEYIPVVVNIVRGYLRDNFAYFLLKLYVVTTHLNHDEGSQHTFLCRTNKNYPLLLSNTSSYLEL